MLKKSALQIGKFVLVVVIGILASSIFLFPPPWLYAQSQSIPTFLHSSNK